jgi:hypothetical protein
MYKIYTQPIDTNIPSIPACTIAYTWFRVKAQKRSVKKNNVVTVCGLGKYLWSSRYNFTVAYLLSYYH